MATLTYDQAKRSLLLGSYREIAEEYEAIINLGIEQRWAMVTSEFAGTDLDPAVEAEEEVELLRLFKYRMSLMLFCCLCETWEQDLCKFLKEKGALASDGIHFGGIKSAFDDYFRNLSMDDFTKISEMRTFVNAIKHGSGGSFEKLKDLLGDSILADSNLGYISNNGSESFFKQIRFDSEVLTSITLAPDGKINEYYNAIVTFWKTVFAEIDNGRVHRC